MAWVSFAVHRGENDRVAPFDLTTVRILVGTADEDVYLRDLAKQIAEKAHSVDHHPGYWD